MSALPGVRMESPGPPPLEEVGASPRSGQGCADPGELDEGIRSGQLVLEYQPKIDLATATVVGVEALVRWMRPARGLVLPDEFISLAERSGLMTALTAFVLDEAARQHAAWREEDLNLPVAVNLSTTCLGQPDLVQAVSEVCERHGIASSALELEITETALLSDPSGAAEVLGRLADRGFLIALDDFGTGYSSLSHLRDLPVSMVKIDKSFVHDLSSDATDSHIVRGTIELARGLGKVVLAEGVESRRTADMLMLMGCDQGQGYLWSRSLAPDVLTRWVHQRRSSPASCGSAPVPSDEPRRLAALRSYRVLDTAYEAIFDDIAAAAARICDKPMSGVSLVDANRQWFKAHVGLGVRETAREHAFCAHTIMDPDRVLVVEDAALDNRFANNPFVTGKPHIRFYAGAPLVSPDGSAIGSLCVLDSEPGSLDADQIRSLRQLADHVILLLETKRALSDIRET